MIDILINFGSRFWAHLRDAAHLAEPDPPHIRSPFDRGCTNIPLSAG
jgi:hypothetical protein